MRLSASLVAIVAMGCSQSELLTSSRIEPKALSGSARDRGVVFAQQELDLGEAYWLAQIPFVAELANHSSEDVVVEKITADCNCTLVDAGCPIVLGAGQSLAIQGIVAATMRLGELNNIIVATMDNGRTASLNVTVSIAPSYTITPASKQMTVHVAAA